MARRRRVDLKGSRLFGLMMAISNSVHGHIVVAFTSAAAILALVVVSIAALVDRSAGGEAWLHARDAHSQTERVCFALAS